MSSNDDLPKTGWSPGAPPSIGWWPASMYCLADRLRWWDGEFWSIAVNIEHSEERINHLMRELDKMPVASGDNQRRIYWTNRPETWPSESYT